jgi:hypothetical protein
VAGAAAPGNVNAYRLITSELVCIRGCGSGVSRGALKISDVFHLKASERISRMALALSLPPSDTEWNGSLIERPDIPGVRMAYNLLF